MAEQAQRSNVTAAHHKVAQAMPYKDAISYLNDLEDITREERNDLIARRNRQNEIETATTNRKVRWDTKVKITEDPYAVSDDYLESLVKPDSLTWDDAEELKAIRDRIDDPLKSPLAQMYVERLNQLRKEPYEKIQLTQKLEDFIKANPKATPQQYETFWLTIIEPMVLGWLDRLFTPAAKEPALLRSRIAEKVGAKLPEAPTGRMLVSPDTRLDLFWPDLSNVEKREIIAALEANPNNIHEILRRL